MKKIKIIFVLVIVVTFFFAISSVLAEEDTEKPKPKSEAKEEKDTKTKEKQEKPKSEAKPKEETHKKWYVYLGAGFGNLDDGSNDKISTTHTRLGFEYRPIPQIGLNFGPSRTKFKIKSPGDPFNLLLLKSFLDAGGGSLGYYSLSILSSLLNSLPQTTSFPITTLDFTFKYHVLGDGKIDPFLGFGLGLGTCGGGADCNAARLTANLGLLYNFDKFFTFAQAEYHSLTLKVKGSEDEEGGASGKEKLLFFGAGMRF